MKVFGFHDGSACGTYRVIQPFDQLAAHGHTTRAVHGSVEPDGDEDLIVGERMDNPAVLPIWRRMKAKARLVFETDDDIYSVDPLNWMAYRVFRHGVPKDTITHAAQVADLITVSTEPLAEVMARETGHRNIRVLPNYVDERLLALARPQRVDDRLVVGWRGGASHARDVGLIAQPLRRFLHRHPTAELHLVGTDFRPTILGQPSRTKTIGGRLRWSDWSDDIWGYYRTVDFDIAVVPLYPTTFAESKSHIPVLEMAALGIPVVASDCTAYRSFVLDGVTGFLVRPNREHDWGRRLHELANDPAMRAEMGAKAREHASQFTIQANWQQWEQAYQSIL